jgi:hypothetical protein
MRGTTVVAVAGLAILVTACGETSTPVGPASPSFELVDETKRLDADDVNAWVYGSFVIEVAGTPGGVIMDGPANFPGRPKDGPGWCLGGTWYNSQGKKTSGNVDRPHPHCIDTGEGTGAVSIILEPISAQSSSPGASGNEFLNFAKETEDGEVKFIGQGGPNAPGTTTGTGIIVAYAIDAATLGGTPQRVGTITIDLTQFTTSNADLFLENCTLGSDATVRCLNKVIDAQYTPLAAPDGLGEAQAITGFLYWTSATSPFNYTP